VKSSSARSSPPFPWFDLKGKSSPLPGSYPWSKTLSLAPSFHHVRTLFYLLCRLCNKVHKEFFQLPLPPGIFPAKVLLFSTITLVSFSFSCIFLSKVYTANRPDQLCILSIPNISLHRVFFSRQEDPPFLAFAIEMSPQGDVGRLHCFPLGHYFTPFPVFCC